jgi:hypothetical protein
MEPRLLTDEELAEIRDGVRSGMRGPLMLKWVAMLLADHDARVSAPMPSEKRRGGPKGARATGAGLDLFRE